MANSTNQTRIRVSYGVFFIGSEPLDDEVLLESHRWTGLTRGVVPVRPGLLALRSLTVLSFPSVALRTWDEPADLPPVPLAAESWPTELLFTSEDESTVTVSAWGTESGPYFNFPMASGRHLVRASVMNLDAARQEAEVDGELETSETWTIDISAI